MRYWLPVSILLVAIVMVDPVQAQSNLEQKTQRCLSNIEGYYDRHGYSEPKLPAKLPAGCEPDIIPLLIERISDRDPKIRTQVAMALGFFGSKSEAAIPALIEALQEQDDRARSTMIGALSRIGKPAVAPLISAIKDKNRPLPIRQSAIWALTALQRESSAIVPLLIETLQAPEPSLRQIAAANLGNLAERSRAAIPALIVALRNDAYPSVRSTVAFALGNSGSTDETVISALVSATRDRAKEVQLDAAGALLLLNRQTELAFSKLTAALQDSDSYIRGWAIWQLRRGRALPKSTLSALVTILKDSDRDNRFDAAELLSDQGSTAPELIPVFREMLQDSNSFSQMQAIDGLRVFGESPIALPLLREMLQNEDSWIRDAAISQLGEMRSVAKEVLPILIELLNSSDSNVQFSASLGISSLASALEENPQPNQNADLIPFFEQALKKMEQLNLDENFIPSSKDTVRQFLTRFRRSR